jgi:16S rRNA (guanine(966)-N(2))-methyltransferase RsmD
MRIIAGKAKGLPIQIPQGEVRPTQDRVREALFNILGPLVENARVLDLFCGSGSVGIEALSRGASSCTFVEKSIEAMDIVKKNARKTGLWDRCKILNSDYKDFIRGAKNGDRFDIVFLDPPYSMKIIPDILRLLVSGGLLNKNAKIICESEDDIAYSCEGLTTVKHNKYGRVYITVLCNAEQTEVE